MGTPLELAERIAERLATVEGVTAVVLGGSHARGTADAKSDLDLGIYYRPERPPSLDALRALARELDDRHPENALTDFGGWGPWINGGGWLQIEGARVDWLYRDLALVSQVLADCRVGRTACHYQPGHPHGFHTHIYVGEVHHGRALFDPEEAFAALQAATVPYPPALKRALVNTFWEAGFALETCHKAAARGDVFYVSGCLFRSVACLVQVLFALNERYFVNEKGSVAAISSAPLVPSGFAERVSTTLAALGSTPAQLSTSVQAIQTLVDEVRALTSAAR